MTHGIVQLRRAQRDRESTTSTTTSIAIPYRPTVYLDQKELDLYLIYSDINKELYLSWYWFKEIDAIVKAYTAACLGFPTYYIGKQIALYSVIRMSDKVILKDALSWENLLYGLYYYAKLLNTKQTEKVNIIC